MYKKSKGFIEFPWDVAGRLIAAASDRSSMSSLTHGFYRYPASISPWLARSIIEATTQPGETVLDPFLGGGTTLVESRSLGRAGIGIDLSELATFVANTKTRLYSELELTELLRWADHAASHLRLNSEPLATSPCDSPLKEPTGRQFAPLRKILSHALRDLDHYFKSNNHRALARCLLLRTAQWALDCRRTIPGLKDFRQQLRRFAHEMCMGAKEFRTQALSNSTTASRNKPAPVRILTSDASNPKAVASSNSPTLILTSPPYPGVHVLYHRWQLNGRRETGLPFAIANCNDGNAESYYTMGSRKHPTLEKYFQTARTIYENIAGAMTESSLLVQVLAFSHPGWQLPRLLETLNAAGFCELKPRGIQTGSDGRLWRSVPNRKFYADLKGATAASEELVLFHARAK